MTCPHAWRHTFAPGLAPSFEATAAVVTAVRARTAAIHRADRDARTQRHRSWVQTATQTGKIFQALRGEQLVTTCDDAQTSRRNLHSRSS